MITRITISQTGTLSADLANPQLRPTPKVIEKEAKATATAYDNYHRMLSYIQQYPDTKPVQLIGAFVSEPQTTTRNITKKKRTYSTNGGITITEEDN